jgi:hypothetical protein
VHADGGGVTFGEQLLRGVEDAVGGDLCAPVGQPVARHQAVTVNGTDNGRRT